MRSAFIQGRRPDCNHERQETNADAELEKLLNIKVVTWSLGLFTAISFVLCVIYGLIVPPSLHMAPFLEVVLPAFKWLTFGGFCLGLIESFL